MLICIDQPRLDSKVTPKSTTWLTRCILFNNGKLYFEEAFFERQKIMSLVLLVLITSLFYLATIVGHGQIQFQWICHNVEVPKVWCRQRIYQFYYEKK